MDRKVVKIKDLQLLESIADLAAFITVETEFYIGLAMYVEEYTKDPSADNFKKMHDILEKCTKHFPKFHNARQMQITRLIAHGNLKINNEGSSQLEPVNPEVEQDPIPDNVVQLFSKKVDKDD